MINSSPHYSADESRPVLWLTAKDFMRQTAMTSTDLMQVVGYKDIVEVADNLLSGGFTSCERLASGCMDSLTLFSTAGETLQQVSIDGTIRALDSVDSFAIDRALTQGHKYRQVLDYSLSSMMFGGTPSDVIDRANRAMQGSAVMKFLYFVNDHINEGIRAKTPKGQEYDAVVAGGAVYIVRSVRFIARTDAELRRVINESLLPADIKRDLTYLGTEKSFYNQLSISTKHVMFVYKVEMDAFRNRKYLLEKTNGVFLTRAGEDVAYHPYSVQMQQGSSSLFVDSSRFSMNAELVYSDSPFAPRFVNLGGMTVELSQKQDFTRKQGLYINYSIPAKDFERDAFQGTFFTLAEDMVEDNGFYLSQEGAANHYTKEQVARRKERFSLKMKAEQDVETLNRQIKEQELKDVESQALNTAKVFQTMLKAAAKEGETLAKEAHLKAEEDREKLVTGIDKEIKQLNQLFEESLKATKESIRENADAQRRHTEAVSLGKRDWADVIKLIPVVLTACVAIINFKKGLKSK